MFSLMKRWLEKLGLSRIWSLGVVGRVSNGRLGGIAITVLEELGEGWRLKRYRQPAWTGVRSRDTYLSTISSP